MRLKFTIPVPDEHTRFAQGCFDAMMGRWFGMEVDGSWRNARVVAVEYPEGGREIYITLSWAPG